MGNQYTFKDFLQEEHDSSKLLEVLYSLDKQLKYLHSKGYYVNNINFDSIIKNEENVFKFMYVDKLPADNSNLYVKGNIDSLAKVSLGAYVYITSYEFGYVGDINSFDYEKISRQNPDYVVQNYEFIRSSIPAADEFGEYYDGVIDGQFGYFCDFVDKKRMASQQNKSSAITMVKSTAIGRAYRDDDAFIAILYYPILIVCVSILSIVIYILILHK